MFKRSWVYAFLVTLAVGSCSTRPPSQSNRDLFLRPLKIEQENSVRALARADVKIALFSDLVTINPTLLAEARGDPSRWKAFNLNVGGTSVVVTTITFDKPSATVERWIASGESGHFAMMIEDGHGAATITADNRSLRLYGTPDPNVQRLMEPDERYILQGDDQAEPPRLKSNAIPPKMDVLCDADHGIQVPPGKGARPTILVLWTPAAQDWLTSQGRQINSEIQLIMTMMSGAMRGIWFEVFPSLAFSQLINYSETATLDSDLNLMTKNQIPNVLQLRNQYAADLVMLIGHYPKDALCGRAWVNEDAAFVNREGSGYSVVNVDVDDAGTTIRTCDLTVSGVHETGHNMGMRHDLPNGGASQFPYNFGYVNLQSRQRTIMAYDTQCQARGFSCPVVHVFSSPNAKGDKGADLGAANANNMEILCRNAPYIERNR